MDEQSRESLEQEIENAEDVIKKLQNFTKELVNDSNSNILTHLCDGLEKFLGYDKTSKGYDGSGIVYSDLDRLCDGVMGFLSGVLSNIKEHLGQHKDTLDSAISILNKNKHAGKNGFNVAIAEVVKGVRGYNERVKRSNENVKKIVTDLQSKVGATFLKTINNVLAEGDSSDQPIDHTAKQVEQAVIDINAKLEECKQNAQTFIDNLDTERSELKTSINDLNSDLKHKLENVRRTVAYESDRLGKVKVQETAELTATITKVSDALGALKASVDCNISDQVKSLVDDLLRWVQKILDELRKVDQKLKLYVENLAGWINAANDAVNVALKRVDDIISHVDWKDKKKYPSMIEEVLTQIEFQVGGLYNNGQGAISAVQDTVKSALAQVKAMDDALKKDLFTVKTHLNGGISSVITGVAQSVAREITSSGQSAVNVFKLAMEGLHKQISNIESQQFKTLKESATTGLEAAFSPVNEGIQNVVSSYKSNIVTTLSDLNTKVLQLTKEFIDAQADELQERIDRQLENMPGTARGQLKQSGQLNGNNATYEQSLNAHKRELEEMRNRRRSMHGTKGVHDIDSYRSHLEALRQRVLQTLNNANSAWQQTISGELRSLEAKIMQLTEPSEIAKTTSERADALMDKLYKRLEALRKLVNCVGDEQVKQQWGQCKSQYDYLNNELETMSSTASGWINKHKSGLLRFVKTAQSVCSRLPQTISSQNPNTHSGFSYTYGQRLRSYNGYIQPTATNQTSKLDELLKLFENDVKQTVSDLISKVGLQGTVPASVHAELTQLQGNISQLSQHIGTVRSSVDQMNSTFEAWIKEAKSSVEQANQQAKEAITKLATEMQTKVTEGIRTVKEEIEEQLKNGSADSGVDINGSNGFEHYKKQIAQDPTTLQALASGNLDRINEGSGTLPSAIKEIRTQVKSALSSIDKFNTEAILKFNDARSHVYQLCSDIKRAADNPTPEGLKQKLTELKNLINNDHIAVNNKQQKGLNIIHSDLNKLQHELANGPLKNAETLHGHATTAGRLTIEALKKHAGEQVKTAQDTLMTHARKQYVLSLKLALQRFAEKTTTELQPLASDISADLEQGHKKFMNMFAATLIDEVKNIDAIDTTSSTKERYPLSKAAVICKDAVKGFVTKLHRHADFTSDVDKVFPSTSALRTLFSKLHHAKHFNKEFEENLESLGNELRGLNPKAYGEGKNPWLFESLKKGLSLLVEEFGKTYISTYSQQTIDWEQATADEKLRYAKVLFTMTPFIYHELTELKNRLEKKNEKWNLYGIYNSSDPQSSLHALFFRDNGYGTSLPDDATHGELNHRETMTGQNIYNHLINTKHTLLIASRSTDAASIKPGDDSGIQVEVVEGESVIDNLYSYSQYYFRVCHFTHIAKPRTPSSVYEMLAWCSGLQFNAVYDPLCQYFKELFKKPEDLENEPYKNIDFSRLSLVGTTTIQPAHLTTALRDVCAESYALLITILGNGHSGGKYACEFSNNSFNLQYPAAPAQCFDMLVDVLNRLYEQLYFLFRQCRNATELSGWYDCHYGRYVGGSDWRCNDKQCPNQTCEQKCKQTRDQIHDQKGDQHPQCGLKSPLQSFLEDGLPGFLPHSFTKPGCKLTCTLSNHRGIPCRTPMGFADISVTASHRQTGEYLERVLKDFCGSESAPLTKLCAQLTCLLQKPPQTLGDIFAFYYGYLEEWAYNFYERFQKDKTYTRDAFREAVNDAYFGKQYDDLNPDTLVSSSKHSDAHTNGNLCSIANCESGSVAPCGLYVKSMTQGISKYYSAEHKANHLSWIVYITETFCDLLKKLYDDCCKKCGSSGTKCHDKSCVEQCSVDYSSDTTAGKSLHVHHDRKCKAIVNCRDTNPTLYRYGFSFGNTWALSGAGNTNKTKRTCKDFCEALKLMLVEDSVLITLRKQIDDFLWAIRTPFSYLVLALWSLSLFYLLCVMVGRLDVLHIRSHLRTPSSHRITAQSLLAAAQVGRLAKISYLQP